MPRGKDLLMEVLQRIGLRYKTSLGLRSRFQVNFLPSSQSLVVIGCLTLSLKTKGILVHEQSSQLGNGVARSIMVIALREWIIVLVLVKVGTKSRTSQM